MTQSAQPAKPRRVLVLRVAFVGPYAPWSQSQRPATSGAAKSAPTTFREITSQLHISLPSISQPSSALTGPIPIRSEDYSLKFARRKLVPAMGGSVVVGDFD